MPITDEQIEKMRSRLNVLSGIVKAMAAAALDLQESDLEEIESIDVCLMIGIDKKLSVGSTCSPEQSLEMCRALEKSIKAGETHLQH